MTFSRCGFFFETITVSVDDSKGYFVQPTVILTKDPKSITMREEIFGPVVTVRLVVILRSHVDRFFLGLCVRRC